MTGGQLQFREVKLRGRICGRKSCELRKRHSPCGIVVLKRSQGQLNLRPFYGRAQPTARESPLSGLDRSRRIVSGSELLRPSEPSLAEIGIQRDGLFIVSAAPGGCRRAVGRRKRAGCGIHCPRNAVHSRERFSLRRNGGDHLVALRIFDHDLEMKLPGAPIEIAVHQPGCVLQVGVADGLDPQGKRA